MYLPDWKWIPIRKGLLLMSNKVIFNLDELFISVGIDVGADFSWMSIALPNQQFVGKPYKILHNSIDSLTTAVSKIKEAEELYSLESRIFLESTGIYHYPLFCYLRDKGFNCSVINPIITKNSTNINIRKVHNDRFDSKKAALVGLKPDLKVSLMPSDLALNCRNLCREYYDLMDNRSAYVNKLQGELRMAFPQYLGIFSKVTINTSLTLLETYTSPSAFLKADKQEIIDIIKSTARFGLTYAQNKYNAIIQAATDANQFGYIIDSNIKRIRLYISFIRKYDEEINSILESLHELVDANEDADFVKQIHLIETFCEMQPFFLYFLNLCKTHNKNVVTSLIFNILFHLSQFFCIKAQITLHYMTSEYFISPTKKRLPIRQSFKKYSITLYLYQ